MSRLPRLARAIRFMHTEGRQIDHQGPSTSPSLHGHIPKSATAVPTHIDTPQNQTFDALPAPPTSSRPTHTPKGRPIPRRPARTISVTLPNGWPEPPQYPPGEEYFKDLDSKKQKQHPLWGFFHYSPSASAIKSDTAAPQQWVALEAQVNDDKNVQSGRSWTAEELRRKSFKDLHMLWYVLLRERNILATQNEERRRLNIGSRMDGELNYKRGFRCRKSMARIKYVLNERRLGFIAAAGPDLPEAPHVPWSASPTSDPAGATEAIRNELKVPLHILQSRLKSKGKAAATSGPEDESFMESEEVNEAEVDARDEGFGGGKEAEEFVKQVQVDEDGKVEKK